MISQGGVDQSPMATGYNRVASSGRILETNTENLLRMVLNVKIPIICSLSYTYLLRYFSKLYCFRLGTVKMRWTADVSYN